MALPDKLLSDPNAWIAASVRQLFRAHLAGDSEAVDLDMIQFDACLCTIVPRLLEGQDAEWKEGNRWLDGLDAIPQFLGGRWLRLQGELTCVIGQELWYHEPFEFEVELNPRTGELHYYRFRFGDERPLEAKSNRSQTGVPVGDWTYTLEHGVPLQRPSATEQASPLPTLPTSERPDLAEKNKPAEEDDDRSDLEEGVAAHARQLYRAELANDAEAGDLSWRFLCHYLKNHVRWLLRIEDTVWGSWGKGSSRHFNTLDAEHKFSARHHLLIRGTQGWSQGREDQCYEPIEYDLELWPDTGTFRRAVLRFGENGPLESKTKRRPPSTAGEWTYVIERE